MNFKTIIFCFAFICFQLHLNAQRVGVVLSGGGSGGTSHIGVLKALEENNIPIDYITGTSIGGLIGGLYASGYSPSEIEELFKSKKFQQFTKGELEKKYVYYFKKGDDDASWFSYRLSLDSTLVTNLPTNLINSMPIDFYLMEMFSAPAAAANYNFDSLFVPFRCVASDIQNKKQVIFNQGSLSTAIRASMTYPFYLRPIKVDDKLMFDGGLYNNFPANIMNADFKPDFLIGSVVTDNSPIPNDDNLYLQLRNMLMTKSDFNPGTNGIIIKPWSDVGIFDFTHAEELIDSGRVAALREMENLKKNIYHYRNKEEVAANRQAFKNRMKPLIFGSINITGVNKSQTHYITKLLSRKIDSLTLFKIKPRYFRLSEDDKIKSMFPTATYNPANGLYDLKVRVKKEKDFIVYLGGNFSNRPISEGFAAIKYNYLGKIGLSIYGNGYFGKLNNSFLGKVRLDFPSKLPFFIESSFTLSRWDYFKSSSLFYNLIRPAYLIQRDEFGELVGGFPVGNKSKLIVGGAVSEIANFYYQSDNFTELDTADRTDLNFGYGKIEYEFNSLNRKLYADEGMFFNLKGKYINALEGQFPGTLSNNSDTIKLNIPHQWFYFKATFDAYLKPSKYFKLGVFGEGVYSTQGLFRNYTSTIMMSPGFTPTPESKTLFLNQFRAHQYLAAGAKMIFSPINKIDLRFEAYGFQPIRSIVKTPDLKAEYSSKFLYNYFVGMATAVYHSPLGPLSVSVNYYYKEQKPFTLLVHFGYIIFNKKSLD